MNYVLIGLQLAADHAVFVDASGEPGLPLILTGSSLPNDVISENTTLTSLTFSSQMPNGTGPAQVAPGTVHVCV